MLFPILSSVTLSGRIAIRTGLTISSFKMHILIPLLLHIRSGLYRAFGAVAENPNVCVTFQCAYKHVTATGAIIWSKYTASTWLIWGDIEKLAEEHLLKGQGQGRLRLKGDPRSSFGSRVIRYKETSIYPSMQPKMSSRKCPLIYYVSYKSRQSDNIDAILTDQTADKISKYSSKW